VDIRKSKIFNGMLYITLAGAILFTNGNTSLCNTKSAADVLVAVRKPGSEATPEEVKSATARLEKALSDCKDNYLSFRIRYEIGVLHFKAHMMTESKSTFLQIASDPNCPEIIRICGLNMTGQISRLTKEDDEAIKTFGQVANSLEQKLIGNKNNTIYAALAKLRCLALLSRAEIYEQQQDYANSINEYTHLLRILHQNESGGLLSQYGPLATDRISQLCLRQKNFDEYIKCVETLTADYPQYYRTPIIKLEAECVKLLKSNPTAFEFAMGSFPAPVYLISYIKDSKNETLGQKLADRFDVLCKQYPNTYGGILLKYHYAWLLDALDEKDKAAEIFDQISSAETGQIDDKFGGKTIIETVQEYAKIQSAIMLAEKADYVNALQILGKLKTHPDKSHLSVLAESVGKNIETLKREIPKNEKK